MKELALLVAVASAMAFAGTTWAGDEQTAVQPRIELDLVDGSHLVGTPAIATIPVRTAYAKMDIALTQIQTIKMGDDHETASVDLQNGDKLTGVITLGPVELATVFGKVAVGIEHIRKIDVVLGGGAGRKGLVLWNRLGSENDVRNSRVGPGGKLNGGRFVQGRFGRGVELNMQEQLAVSFPAAIVPATEGCIEFWAKLVGFPGGIPEGPNPALIKMGPETLTTDNTFEFCLAPNDGLSNGGLFIHSTLGWVGTGAFGAWTYARALGVEDAAAWHHYALVWKGNGGIPGVTDTGSKIVAYVDGKLNTATGRNNPDVKSLAASAATDRLFFLGRATTSIADARIAFDNLKVWNYAKTDFDDRNHE